MKSIPHSFYKSKAWQQCRASYLSKHSLCERCLEKGLIVPAEIVHHKIYLNEENYKDPSVSLNHENLEAVCKTCHNQEHMSNAHEQRWRFNAAGELETLGE